MRAMGAGLRAAAALLILAGAGAIFTPAAVAGPASPAPVCADDFGSKVPVLLVHGFHEGTDVWGSMTKAIQTAIPEVKVVTPFDYPTTEWVTDQSVGPQLARVIRCLATDSTNNDGAGKVIIVAHSMGGLVVRCAVDPSCAGTDAVNPQQIGLVITLGTPNTGSLLGTVGNALSSTGVIACEAILALQTGLNLPCPDLGGWLFGANSPAAQAMAVGLDGQPSQDLSALQPLPSTIPLDAIAGQFTVTTSLFDLGSFRVSGPQFDLGDLVVPVASALDGAPPTSPAHPGTSTPHPGPGSGTVTIPCGTISVSNLVGPLPASVVPGVTCWHLTETTDSVWQGDVIAAIQPAARALSLLPDFYYMTPVEPENLYVNPAYPKTLGIDNHDWITIQSLNAWDPDSMTMTGVLNYDECKPACAAGPMVTFPVQVVATAPQTCTVQVGELGSTSAEEAYVYSKINVNALSGGPPSFLIGNSVFKVCG